MRFSSGRRQHKVAEISVVPLIDLFLNILVFFMVTTSFTADSVFFVDLPEAKASDRSSDEKQFVVAIGAWGEIAINRRSVSLEDLAKELVVVDKSNRETFPVILRADRKAFHGRVVAVIDIIRDLGFRNVGMATKVNKKEPS